VTSWWPRARPGPPPDLGAPQTRLDRRNDAFGDTILQVNTSLISPSNLSAQMSAPVSALTNCPETRSRLPAHRTVSSNTYCTPPQVI
jgi:hypothetical protein